MDLNKYQLNMLVLTYFTIILFLFISSLLSINLLIIIIFLVFILSILIIHLIFIEKIPEIKYDFIEIPDDYFEGSFFSENHSIDEKPENITTFTLHSYSNDKDVINFISADDGIRYLNINKKWKWMKKYE